jgi:hypothetical protein
MDGMMGKVRSKKDEGRSEGGEQAQCIAADGAFIGCVILHTSKF